MGCCVTRMIIIMIICIRDIVLLFFLFLLFYLFILLWRHLFQKITPLSPKPTFRNIHASSIIFIILPCLLLQTTSTWSHRNSQFLMVTSSILSSRCCLMEMIIKAYMLCRLMIVFFQRWVWRILKKIAFFLVKDTALF